MKTRALIIVLLCILFVLIGSMLYLLSGDTIQPNVKIEGIDVGGLTKEEALQRINDEIQTQLEDNYISLRFEDKTWKVNYSDINFEYKYSDAVDTAYTIAKQGNILENMVEAVKTRMNGKDISILYSYDSNRVNELLFKISKEIDQQVQDATIKLESQGFVIKNEKHGRVLDKDKAFNIIITEIDKVSISVIDLPVIVTEPQITRNDLINIKDKIGEYKTKFNAADVDRTYNIMLATKSVSNVLVKPGEVFSLNKTVGPRLEKYGYKIAKVVVNNELVPGIGGGVCQVSTTLYNAALLANLKIVERKNHSLPSSYVALGRDATISGDYIDLKFQNNTNTPIYIYGEVKGSFVTFSLYGCNENPNRRVQIKTQLIKKTEPQIQIIEDPTLPVGTEIEEKKAYTGYIVKSYRVIYEGDKEVFVEPLFTDVYRVSNGIKRVGTKVLQEEINITDEM